RSSTATSHSLPQEASPSVGSSTSLRSSGRLGAVTGGGGSPLPRLVAASAASRERGTEVPKPGHEGAPRVAPAEMLRAAPLTGPRWHETTPATTVAGVVSCRLG